MERQSRGGSYAHCVHLADSALGGLIRGTLVGASADPVAAYPVKTGALVKTIVMCSGGLDSVTLAHKVAAERTLTRLVSFDYSQRHNKELKYARCCAMRLMAPHDVVDIAVVGRLLTGSALTSGGAVPEGHYAEETMRATVVPNRNAIMLAIAFGVAAAERADAVAAAVHGGDHFIYPDCRPAFVEAFEAMQRHALDGVARISFSTPFLRMSKADIVREGARLKSPLPKPGLATRAALSIAVAAGPASSGARPFILPAWTIQRRTRTRITGSKRAGSTGPDNSHRVVSIPKGLCGL
jgi:7-cyano-7-deazaguanine synthase